MLPMPGMWDRKGFIFVCPLLQDLISAGSEELFYATHGLAYIDSVNILLPSTWIDSYDASLTSEYFYEDGDIRFSTISSLKT